MHPLRPSSPARRIGLSIPLLAALAVSCASLAHGAVYSWTGPNGTWSSPANWNGGVGGTPGSVADTAIINSGVALTPRLVALDGDTTVGVFGAGFHQGAAVGTTVFNTTLTTADSTPRTLTVGSSVSGGVIRVASGVDTFAKVDQSTLTVSNGVKLALVGGEFMVGAITTTGTTHTHSELIGTVSLAAGSSLDVGTTTNRSTWVVGRKNVTHSNTGIDRLVDGRVVASAGSNVSAYLSTLIIGNNEGRSSADTLIKGAIDLRQATVSAFDVAGDAVIGHSLRVGATQGGGSQGALRLANTSARVGGNLLIGDNRANSDGLLDLANTTLSLEGNAVIDLSGQVSILAGGTSSGLRLSATSALTINALGANASDANAGYFITFENPDNDFTGIYFGLAWEGDKVAAMNNLVGNFAITWDNQMTLLNPTVFYDLGSNTTYLGVHVVPEPGTWVFGALAGVTVLLARRRKAAGNP